MNFKLSERLKSMKPSATFALSAKASELREQGHDVIALTVGEPDYDAPQSVIEAAVATLQDKSKRASKYTAVDGLKVLKKNIIEKFQRDNELSFTLGEVIASTGAKQTLSHAMLAVLNPGDEVLIFAPYWVSYPEMARLCGAEPVVIQTTEQTRFLPTVDQITQAITPKTRMIILNSPSNPTGSVFKKQELIEIADLLRQYPDILIMSDDIYEYLVYDKADFYTILNVAPDLKERVLTINGLSKSHAMTGWRLGFAGGPEPWIAAMRKLQGQTTSNPTTITQYAAIEALKLDRESLVTEVVKMRDRRDLICQLMNDIPGFSCLKPDGAFYLFVNISQAMALMGYKSDADFARDLLEKSYVATVPGSAFGAQGYLRLSFALAEDELKKAAERISSFVNV